MSRKQKFFQVVKANTDILRSYGVEEIGLFGSVSREEDRGESDYDVLVAFVKGQKTYENFTRLVDFLENSLQEPVELVTPEGLSPYLEPYILQEVEYVPLAS